MAGVIFEFFVVALNLAFKAFVGALKLAPKAVVVLYGVARGVYSFAHWAYGPTHDAVSGWLNPAEIRKVLARVATEVSALFAFAQAVGTEGAHTLAVVASAVAFVSHFASTVRAGTNPFKGVESAVATVQVRDTNEPSAH